MPEITLTERKRQVSRWATEHEQALSTSKISRLATRLHKQPHLSPEDAEEYLSRIAGGRVHEFRDPTPAEAFRNMQEARRD